MCFRCAQTTLFLPVSYFILNHSMIYPQNAAPFQSPFLNCKTHRGRLRDRFLCCVTLRSLSLLSTLLVSPSPVSLSHFGGKKGIVVTRHGNTSNVDVRIVVRNKIWQQWHLQQWCESVLLRGCWYRRMFSFFNTSREPLLGAAGWDTRLIHRKSYWRMSRIRAQGVRRCSSHIYASRNLWLHVTNRCLWKKINPLLHPCFKNPPDPKFCYVSSHLSWPWHIYT